MDERQRVKVLRESIDPEMRRWHESHPRRPTVPDCLDLLGRHNTHGVEVDLIAWELEQQARLSPDMVIEAARECESEWPRLILLQAIEVAAIEEAIPLFSELLRHGNDSERSCAVRGLKAINSKLARTVLFESGIE